jgi:hypothetical protein
VADRAGKRWVAAEVKKGEELARIPKAKGTQGNLRGKPKGGKPSGRALLEPPDNTPTRAELGVGKKERGAGLSQRLAAKALGVDHKTIRNDPGKKSPHNGEKVPTIPRAKDRSSEELERGNGAPKRGEEGDKRKSASKPDGPERANVKREVEQFGAAFARGLRGRKQDGGQK